MWEQYLHPMVSRPMPSLPGHAKENTTLKFITYIIYATNVFVTVSCAG